MRNRILMLVLFLTLSNSVMAVGVTGKVARLYPQGDIVYFRLKNDTCNTGNDYYTFNMTTQAPAAKNWYALLLAAGVSQQEVRVAVADCTAGQDKQVIYIYQDY